MAYVIKAGAAVSTSPLDRAPLDRAADVLRLARMGNSESKRMWNTWVAENPGTARIVKRWVDQEDAETAKATRVADKMLARAEATTRPAVIVKAKGSGQCLDCGDRMKAKWPRCRRCGTPNKFHQPKGSAAMKGKKLRKRQQQAVKAASPMLTKAGGRPVKSRAQAVQAWIADDLNSCDPARREAARAALARLR